MRPSAKSDPKRKRGVSLKTIRLRKRARMNEFLDMLESVAEINADTEGSVVDRGPQGAEVIEIWDRDSDVSVCTPSIHRNVSL